jgi:hypothetical protein
VGTEKLNDPFLHSYAKQRMWELGNKIFISGEQVLVPKTRKETTIYDVHRLDTHIQSNSELVEKGETKQITDYSDLIRMGYMIISQKATSKYFRGQSVIYELKRYNAHIPSLNTIPQSHKIEYDELNERIQLTGKNAGPLGKGPWISLTPKTRLRSENVLNMVDNYAQIKRRLLARYIEMEEIPDIVKIPEIPIMISAQGEVVCLEETKDQPVIGIVGGRGSGKTLIANSIIYHVYWKKPNTRIAILNDSLYQTMPWTFPSNRTEGDSHDQGNIFVRGAAKLGEHPMPLPVVFLHPNTDTLRETLYPAENISFKTSIPFSTVIQNYNYFLKGKKEWMLGKSAPYFRNIKDELLKCSTLDEVEEVLDVAVEEEKLNKQSKEKIFSMIIDMFNQKILDVNTNIPAEWEVHRKGFDPVKLNPVLACMEAGVVPSVITRNLLPKDYFPQYMRYFIDSIFEYQVQVAKYRDEATWIFIDELPDVSSTENRTVAAESLRRCVTEGRNPYLGTMFALQSWTKVDPLIRNNTTHLLSYHNKANETQAIQKDFDLPTHIAKDIINLQKFRLVAMTHEKFVVYNPDGERYTTEEPIKGMAVMPLSQHQAPGGTSGLATKGREEVKDYDEFDEGEEDEESTDE